MKIIFKLGQCTKRIETNKKSEAQVKEITMRL